MCQISLYMALFYIYWVSKNDEVKFIQSLGLDDRETSNITPEGILPQARIPFQYTNDKTSS